MTNGKIEEPDLSPEVSLLGYATYITGERVLTGRIEIMPPAAPCMWGDGDSLTVTLNRILGDRDYLKGLPAKPPDGL